MTFHLVCYGYKLLLFSFLFFAFVYPVFSLNLWKHRLVSQYDLSNFLSHEVDATYFWWFVRPNPHPSTLPSRTSSSSLCPSHLRYSDALCHRFCICVFWIWAKIFLWFFCFVCLVWFVSCMWMFLTRLIMYGDFHHTGQRVECAPWQHLSNILKYICINPCVRIDW